MPKKINALREKLLMCAREILVGRGYSELTIRAIATECGVVPGTIYNYFPSKEKLVESVMLEDWRARRAMLDVKMQEAGSALEAIRVLAEALDSFVESYHEIWEKHPATMNDSSTFRKHHKQLVTQMCGMLQPIMEKYDCMFHPVLPQFLAEALLVLAADEDKHFESVEPILRKETKKTPPASFLTLRHRKTHTASCKCGICVPAAHKLCARQDASLFQAQPNRNPAKRFLFGEEQQRSG